MAGNWVTIFNRLFEIINQDGECYFSGSRFCDKAREFDRYFPEYQQYIAERRQTVKSTSRKSYFYDILMGFDEDVRLRLLNSILTDVEVCGGEKVTELRGLLSGKAIGPTAAIPNSIWGAERLNEYLTEIDSSIGSGNYKRAVTVSYTCLEGLYKAFVKQNISDHSGKEELIALSREVKQWLSRTIPAYPDEALSMINHISHTVDRARNRFSDSHFDEQAARWLAIYIRDLVNSQARLLLHFM